MKKKKLILINEILKNFNFKSVNIAMKSLNWEWYNEGVPTVSQLKDCARDLLVRAVKEKTTISTGGFTAKYDKKHKTISLYFAVDESIEEVPTKDTIHLS